MNLIPIALFWLLAVWGAASRRPVLLYLFFASMPFGAFAVIPPALTGGLTLTAMPIIALLLIGRTFADHHGPSAALALALRPQSLMLLTMYWIVAAVTTAFMPRLFAGYIPVIAIRGNLDSTIPLQPTSQNFSQFTYLSISILTIFAFARMLQAPAMRQHALTALCLGGAVTVGTGLLDYSSQYLPIKEVLAPFRTASYALATDVEVFGSKRVVGLMPEASAFGGLCLAFASTLYFYRRAVIDARFRDWIFPVVIVLLVGCGWLSKSTGTYVGMALLFLAAAVEWGVRIHGSNRSSSVYRRGLTGELAGVTTLIILVAMVALFSPDILNPIYEMVDRMVLQKGSSDSYIQRGMWRSVAYATLWKSHGLGVGLGASRASSSVVAIFSGTGLLGGALFYAFLLQTFLRRTYRTTVENELIVSAFRFSIVPILFISFLVGDANFGGVMAFSIGLTTAMAVVGRRHKPHYSPMQSQVAGAPQEQGPLRLGNPGVPDSAAGRLGWARNFDPFPGAL